MQEQVEDQELAGLAHPRPAVARPTASTDPTILAPVPAPLDCPYLHLDDDGPGCLALAPAIRLSRRQVELVCAGAAHLACPRLVRADAGRAPAPTEPPPAIARRRDRPPLEAPAAAAPPSTEPARAAEPTADATAPDGEPPAPHRPAAAAVASSRITAALTLVRVTARSHIVLRPVTALAWVILVATLVIVIALLSARGGLTLPAAATPSPGLAEASPSLASAAPTVAITPSRTPSPTPLATPTPSPTPLATPSPSPSPSASGPFPPDRLAVLTACPGKPGCYQYKIKSNDNLSSLAKFFGVTYPALLAANPRITNPSIIHVGELITIPLPVPTATSTPKP